MNKHSQIREIIREHDAYGPLEDFQFQIGKTVLNSSTWASMQQSAKGEVIDILLRNSVQSDSLKFSDESDLDPVSADDRFHDFTEDVPADIEFGRGDTNSAGQEAVPVVLPFLAWAIKDEPDESSQLTVTDQFLETIYLSLPASCQGARVDQSNNLVGSGNMTETRLSTKSKISIVGKTANEVADFALAELALAPDFSRDKSRCEIQFRFYSKMKNLFEYFVPKGHDQSSAAIQLYWGAIYELLVNCTRKEGTMTMEYLDELSERVEGISAPAEEIHRGVYYKRNVITSHGEVTLQDAISGSARLLASMVDSLGAIFDMIVQIVHETRVGSISRMGDGKWKQTFGAQEAKSHRYAGKACKLLFIARDELIAESTGFSQEENIGSVLTSQAILILLIERLVGGVYGSGSIDIMAIFDECLAQLVSLSVERVYTKLRV